MPQPLRILVVVAPASGYLRGVFQGAVQFQRDHPSLVQIDLGSPNAQLHLRQWDGDGIILPVTSPRLRTLAQSARPAVVNVSARRRAPNGANASQAAA